ncbi:MAG: hypothetical protein LBU83_07600 [Bacteroidales bacterium]|jgi:aspartate racemase|nr:hypothetical protein [Bacteroidales bacterium]
MFLNIFTYENELNRATALLKQAEDCIPHDVKNVIKHCVDNDVGFVLSRNVKALSCKDARSKRYRLGHTGIPLYDELKSIVFKGNYHDGTECIIAAHSRGHLGIDEHRLSELCQISDSLTIMPEEELRERFNMEFGTVNPITIEINSKGFILNVFDVSITQMMAKSVDTMMTNAGNHTWAIEFDPVILMNSLKQSVIGTIAILDAELKPWELSFAINPKPIGIITGNGPDSGISLWNRINNHFNTELGRHFVGDISLPPMHIISLPTMGLSMELDKRNTATWETIKVAVELMKKNNVELLALACHTTHYYTDKIRELYESETRKFVSMAETTIKYVRKENMRDIAILGISHVANLDNGYSAYTQLKDLEIETIPSNVLSQFDEIGYAVKKMNDLYKYYQQLLNLIKTKIKSKNVIIALTELSILYEQFHKENNKQEDKRRSEKKIIDPLDLYAREIVLQSMIGNKGDIKSCPM